MYGFNKNVKKIMYRNNDCWTIINSSAFLIPVDYFCKDSSSVSYQEN